MTSEQKRDLVVRLAERVMGWKVRTNAAGVVFADYAPPDEDGNHHSYLLFRSSSVYRTWNPLTDDADALALVAALQKRHYHVTIDAFACDHRLFNERMPEPSRRCKVQNYLRHNAWAFYGDTLAEAICLAADAAVRG